MDWLLKLGEHRRSDAPLSLPRQRKFCSYSALQSWMNCHTCRESNTRCLLRFKQMVRRSKVMRLGRHMPTNAKPIRAAQIAQQIGCDAIQIFASNPTAWRPPADDPATNMAFAQATRDLQLDPVVLHAPYLINLGTLDSTIWEKSVNLLSWTLQRGAQLGASRVVFHTGSHRGAGIEVGIA